MQRIAMRLQGKINNWDDDKGFGFVEQNGGGERAFVHIKAWKTRFRRPANGDVIIYELARENNNRLKAVNVHFSKDSRRSSKRGGSKQNSRFGHYFFIAFIGLLITSTALSKLPLIVPLYFLLMSVITFCAYAFDKSAARDGRWRTPESTLHFWSLIGGWSGALLAQNILRHKSSKVSFKRVYKVTVLLNVGIIFWLHTAQGESVLNHVMALSFIAIVENTMLEFIHYIKQEINTLFVI